MSAAYRQKLLDWFCSMGLVLLAMIMLATHGWFFELSDRAFSHGNFDTVDIVVTFGETLILYPVLAPLFMFWHFFDFVEKARPNSIFSRYVTSYSIFLWFMAVNLGLYLLMSTGVLEYDSCKQMKKALYFQCYTRPSYWFMIPWFATLAIAVLLCFVKAGLTIRLYFKKSQ